MKANMSRFGTRMRISSDKAKAGTAGIVVGTPMGGGSNCAGFFFEITTTAAAGSGSNNIRFYELRSAGASVTKHDLWSGKIPIYPSSTNTTDNQFNSTANAENKIAFYDIEVSRAVRSAGQWVFSLFINGRKVKSLVYKVPSGRKFYNGAGMFVTANSSAAFENFWAAKGNVSAFNGSEDSAIETEFRFNDLIKYGEASSALDKEFLSKSAYSIFYEEFGSPVKECKYFNAKYAASPALQVQLVNRPKAEDPYAIRNFRSGSFGAKFLVCNLSKGLINIGADPTGTSHPLAIYGQALEAAGDRVLDLTTIVTSSGNKGMLDKLRGAKRRLGRAVAVDITGGFIADAQQAEELALYYADKLTDESFTVSTDVFGNPCYQVGDIVMGNFTEPSITGWHEYIVVGISQDFTVGLTTSLNLRRLDKW
jgi:hypothetical protein